MLVLARICTSCTTSYMMMFRGTYYTSTSNYDEIKYGTATAAAATATDVLLRGLPLEHFLTFLVHAYIS
jgi:hypothetical protein